MNEDNNDKKNRPEIVRPIQDSPTQVTLQQIGICMGVVNGLSQYIQAAVIHGEGMGTTTEVLPRKKLVDPEAEMSAVSTLIRACNRIDAILDDEERWKVGEAQTLELALIEKERQNALMYQANADAMRNALRPSTKLSAKIRVLANGQVIAFVGDPERGNAIVGIGETAEEALRDFDTKAGAGPAPASVDVEVVEPKKPRTNRKPAAPAAPDAPTA